MHALYPEAVIFERLNTFLKSIPSRYAKVTIADCVDGKYSIQEPALKAADLRKYLWTQRQGIQTRIILLEYESKETLDPDFVAILASCYDIDPVFLFNHLNSDPFDRGDALQSQPSAPLFQSERTFVELKLFDSYISGLLCLETKQLVHDSDSFPTGKLSSLPFHEFAYRYCSPHLCSLAKSTG